MEWFAWVILIAAVFLSIFLLPPLIQLIKTKDSTNINLPMYIIYLYGCILFILGAILTGINIETNREALDLSKGAALGQWLPTFIAQTMCLFISSITLGIKLKNMREAKKRKISESEYIRLKIKNNMEKR